MNCLLTGATGILGSHILFEWLRKVIVDRTVDQIYLIVRDDKQSAEDRLKNILTNASRPDFLNDYDFNVLYSKITLIAKDLAKIKKEDLEAYSINSVIHCAGSTQLLQTHAAKQQVQKQNYEVTERLIEQLPQNVERFLYISTAYSFGIQSEKVEDEIAQHQVTKFRNPYEQSKYESEVLVKRLCKVKKIQAQILRPSIICGRLLEAPFYETPKYDVFYSWAIFLDKYAKKSLDKFRIWIDKNSGLNIVPVDFVSKAVLYALNNPSIKELNIVNPKQILHKDYVGKMLEFFNVNTYEYASEKPENLSLFEQFYYKSIGGLFEKYVSVPDLQFKADEIKVFIKKLQLDMTLGVHENFMNLINYSVQKEFKKSY